LLQLVLLLCCCCSLPLLLLQLYTAQAPFAGHCGYGHWWLDAFMDQVDFWRELAALGYYGLRGWL
jgi:hypothetical protein